MGARAVAAPAIPAIVSRLRRHVSLRLAANVISALTILRWKSTRSPSHGILWEANKDQLNLDRKSWKPGIDYTAAPSCTSCHMSATRSQDVTHDVGERISWTLRPAISTKLNMVVFDDLSKMDVPEGQPVPKVGDERKGSDGKTRKVTQVLTWQDRRERMREVCTSCHASGQVDGFYTQFDNLVDLYNDKFAKPAAAIMAELYKANKLTPAPMDESWSGPIMSSGTTKVGVRAMARRCPVPTMRGGTAFTMSPRISICTSFPR
jgi:cytochrome c553